MQEYIETAFSGPPLLASCLLTLVVCYWLLVIIGMIDLEGLNLDVDIDVDVDSGMESMLSLGMLPLRWLNVGRVPFMLWLSSFAVAFWMVSMLWDTAAGRENLWNMAAVVLRNGALGLLAAKLVTQPLCGVFDTDAQGGIRGRDLVGCECLLTTSVTEKSGQAKVETGKGAPLLLSVRCEFGELEKGELAEIVQYNKDARIYIVRRLQSEEQL
jgi:hypothetical protein